MIELQQFQRVFAALLLATALTAVLSGCSQFNLRDNIPWGTGKDGKFDSPMQVVPFWTTGVQNQGDRQGLRGLGGRLYFYGKSPNKPVKVKGTLVIYAFDEKGRDPRNMVPDRKYVFTPDQFQNKFSKTDLGPSYSVWLPWDEVGGPEKQVSLIVRFTTENGEMVSGEQIKVRLPGASTDSPTVAAGTTGATGQSVDPALAALGSWASQYAVRPASVQQPVAGADGGAASSGVVQAGATANPQSSVGVGEVQVKRMSTTTIPISTSPQSRLLQPASSQGAAVSSFNDATGSPLRTEMLSSGAIPSMALANARMQLFNSAPNLAGQYAASGYSPVPTNPAPMNQGFQSFPPSSGATSLSEVRSGLEKPRVLGGPIARLENVRAPTQPSLAAQQSGPPSAP